MTDAPAAYTPPAGCSLRDVQRWRNLVDAGRAIGGGCKGRPPGLRTHIKEAAKRAQLPAGHNSTYSVFMRLLSQLQKWPPVAAEDRGPRAADIRALAEAVARELGDAHDEAEAGRMLNLTRPRADLEN